MNVRPSLSASWVTVDDELVVNGSLCLSGGRSEVPGRGLGYLVA